MEKPIINYESLIRITRSISMIRDPEEIVLISVEGVTSALKVKGCTLFLFDKQSDVLSLAGSYGLSNGPPSSSSPHMTTVCSQHRLPLEKLWWRST